MNNYFQEGNLNTPRIKLDATSGLLIFFGRSIPENPIKFYEPIEKWFKKYLQTNPSQIIFQIHLDYLNTHSTECVLILMKILESYYKSSKADVKIIWNFDEDDEDMDDLGKDLSTLVDIPFETIEVFEED